MKITWFGTASLLIEHENDSILIDPFLTLRGAENLTALSDYHQAESILVTHGHIDHLGSIPLILRNLDATVYCSECPCATLERRKVDEDQIVTIRPGDTLHFGDIKVNVLSGKHIQFDSRLIKSTFLNLRILRYFPNLVLLLLKNHSYQEGNETLAFQITCGHKKVLVLGSLGLNEQENYPKNVDMLVLPYQGASDLITPTLAVIRQIKPRTVLLDHFDDAFPPISRKIDTKPLKKALAEHFPGLPVVKPTSGKPITLL